MFFTMELLQSESQSVYKLSLMPIPCLSHSVYVTLSLWFSVAASLYFYSFFTQRFCVNFRIPLRFRSRSLFAHYHRTDVGVDVEWLTLI